MHPTDCFALIAQLLEQSGAYHHIRMCLPQANDMYITTANFLRSYNARIARDGTLDSLLRALHRRIYEQDAQNWVLRVLDHDQWMRVGRAWSLMLPFLGPQGNRDVLSRKRAVLGGARSWLRAAACYGHDPLWFDRHWLPQEMIESAEHHLDTLNREVKSREQSHRYQPIEFQKLEDCLQSIAGLSDMIDKEIDPKLLAIGEEDINAEWQTVWAAADRPVTELRSELGQESTMPRWWRSALRLLIASDEACVRLGCISAEYFDVLRLGAARARVHDYIQSTRTKTGRGDTGRGHADSQFGNEIDVSRDAEIALEICGPSPPGHIASRDGYFRELRSISFTFAGIADFDVVCVFPKSRTPSAGTTIRNLSNHLALLPPRGTAHASLRRGEERAFRRNRDLNLLLVPFPFRISASAFVDAHPAADGTSRTAKWFDLRQEWLMDGLTGDLLTRAIDILCIAARREVKEIDAIIFPEQALNYSMYAALALHISRNHPDVELLIAGTSERPDRRKIDRRIAPNEQQEGRDYERVMNEYAIRLSSLAKVEPEDLKKGNFVGTTTFLRYGDEDVSTYLMTFQHKHHRWRLEGRQILGYGIEKNLSPDFDWWEELEVANRGIEFTTFRGSSTVVALICEDLARIEPSQELIRAVGPNLVVALLLDGPQHQSRWSARYATVLADDPGSSVLSLTSMGLIARSATPQGANANCIALWKDDSGKTIEIHLPTGCHAAVLTLRGERRIECTLDGRDDAGLAISWHYQGCIPILDNGLSQPLPAEFTGRKS